MSCLVSKDGNDHAVSIPATGTFNQTTHRDKVALLGK
jgi:hypothetical protein